MLVLKPLGDSFIWDLIKDAAKFLVGAATGWVLKVIRDRWRTRKARSFWRPFLSSDLRLVIGRFGEFRDFERSGMLGVGDAIALAELQRYLGQIGGSEPQVVYADRLEGDALKHTLISLGGPDANAVTREALKLINSKVRFGDPFNNEIAIRDTGVEPARLYVPSTPDRDGTATDYGVIIRAPNPFAPEKEIMIIAGSFGHGTVAGERYVTSPAFLALPASKARDAFECLVETNVVRDAPQAIRLTVMRSIVTDRTIGST
jgi:hypothetical protein